MVAHRVTDRLVAWLRTETRADAYASMAALAVAALVTTIAVAF